MLIDSHLLNLFLFVFIFTSRHEIYCQNVSWSDAGPGLCKFAGNGGASYVSDNDTFVDCQSYCSDHSFLKIPPRADYCYGFSHTQLPPEPQQPCGNDECGDTRGRCETYWTGESLTLEPVTSAEFPSSHCFIKVLAYPDNANQFARLWVDTCQSPEKTSCKNSACECTPRDCYWSDDTTCSLNPTGDHLETYYLIYGKEYLYIDPIAFSKNSFSESDVTARWLVYNSSGVFTKSVAADTAIPNKTDDRPYDTKIGCKTVIDEINYEVIQFEVWSDECAPETFKTRTFWTDFEADPGEDFDDLPNYQSNKSFWVGSLGKFTISVIIVCGFTMLAVGVGVIKRRKALEDLECEQQFYYIEMDSSENIRNNPALPVATLDSPLSVPPIEDINDSF